MQLSENAETVLQKRYYKEGEDWTRFVTRVTDGVVTSEKNNDWEDDFLQFRDDAFNLIYHREFLPNSPCLMNAGVEGGYGNLAACFVLPIDDDLRSIKLADYHSAIIHQSGGGTGFNFSAIRPRGSTVRGSGGVASGPVSFLKMIDSSCEVIKQGGTRRGANMGILRVDHPDILDFIRAKEQDGDISNFNISVGITAEFMAALQENGTYCTTAGHVYGASFIWDLLIEAAHRNGDPGVLFLDHMEAHNPTPQLGVQDTTNPCGEQPLLPYEACVLGSIDLSKFIDHDRNDFDWIRLGKAIHIAIRFLDDMIEASDFPVEAINERVKHGNRRVGLGVMGWADSLYHLGIAYDSSEAFELAGTVAAAVDHYAVSSSERLAEVRAPFGNWVGSKWHKAFGKPRRNATVTTIAPTGTISMIADCSSGIEPVFSLAYKKNVMRDWKTNEPTSLVYGNQILRRHLADIGREEELTRISDNSGQLPDGLPDNVYRIFKTAFTVAPSDHVKMQAVWQKFTENAVSKTINMPTNATIDDVDTIYRTAYDLGCVGVTVYRDGSREGQVLTSN